MGGRLKVIMMNKLYTLENLSAFSADAVYKIGLTLEQYGLTEDNILSFDDYDSIFSKVLLDLEDGHHTIIAVETNDYNVVKRDLIGRFIIEEQTNEEIEEIITLNAGDDISEIDLSGHCLLPASAQAHITSDGLYSGFTVDVLSGKITLIPLDLMRIDSVLERLRLNVMEKIKALESGDAPMIQMPDYDFVPCVGAMVSSLTASGKKLALATSEATMWVYNLYDKVEYLTEAINFVEIIDEDISEEETTAESESVRVIRHAREAMNNTDSDFGGAVSEIYSTENEEGKTVYFAYAAVADKYAAKAKKINTMNPDDLSVILPHAVSVLTQIVCQKNEQEEKAEAAQAERREEPEQKKQEEKKLSTGMMAFAAVIFLVAVIVPILFVFGPFKQEPATTAAPSETVAATTAAPESTEASTQPTTSSPFGSDEKPDDIKNKVDEPTVTDVSAEPTTTMFVSESGTFNFYVFGYGHGVGLSQVGANYLAKEGWNWAEILAHYYYDPETSIVTGDTYPEKIKYEGVEYDTREYLAHALEAEMGSSFHKEALKAQATALYTFAKYNKFDLDSGDNAFTNDTPSDKIYEAVDEIIENGVYVANGGSVACTPFHSMSAGITTSNKNVWGQSVSYLSGGRKSYGDYLDKDFKQVYTISSDELKSIITQKTGKEPSGDPATWISIVSHDSCVREDIGYVSTINVCGKLYTGYDFRSDIMEGRIRSHCFTIEYIPNATTTTTTAQ